MGGSVATSLVSLSRMAGLGVGAASCAPAPFNIETMALKSSARLFETVLANVHPFKPADPERAPAARLARESGAVAFL
jgi:hypothetical protein